MIGMQRSFYWHDYETFGIDPQRDRPAQFAGLRTDEALRPIGDPLVVYCRPADDYLPQPEACLITGITPQLARERGLPEAEFIARIHDELAKPGTCALGYNTLRFDDEVTRNTLYRNLYDPYAREWQNGNSRWDLIDVTRLTRALRPAGIEWPDHADGTPSFRLEDLTAANGIEHGAAHDALADVQATIALARLIRKRQGKLFDYVYTHRDKRHLSAELDPARAKPVVHVSARYPATRGCLAVVIPLAWHPVNRNAVIVYDLSADPEALLTLDAGAIRERLFTTAEQRPEGSERIPLKLVHINKAPVIVPYATLRAEDAERLGIDRVQCEANHALIASGPPLTAKLHAVFETPDWEPHNDPDLMIYSGGFFNDADRARMDQIRVAAPEQLARMAPSFDDPRLPEMLFRYRARNYPNSLSATERTRWQAWRRERLLGSADQAESPLTAYRGQLAVLRSREAGNAAHLAIIDALETYCDELAATLPTTTPPLMPSKM